MKLIARLRDHRSVCLDFSHRTGNVDYIKSREINGSIRSKSTVVCTDKTEKREETAGKMWRTVGLPTADERKIIYED